MKQCVLTFMKCNDLINNALLTYWVFQTYLNELMYSTANENGNFKYIKASNKRAYNLTVLPLLHVIFTEKMSFN